MTDLAIGGLKLAGQYFQKRGLAGAVGADHSVAVALGKLDVHILEQRLFSYS